MSVLSKPEDQGEESVLILPHLLVLRVRLFLFNKPIDELLLISISQILHIRLQESFLLIYQVLLICHPLAGLGEGCVQVLK